MKSEYRIVRRTLPSGRTYEGIYRVYYDDENLPCSRSEELATLLAPTTKGLAVEMADFRAAFDKPILLETNDLTRKFIPCNHPHAEVY